MGRSNRRVGKAGLRPAVVSVFLGVTAVGAAVIPAVAQNYSFSNVVVQGNERVDVPTVLSFAGIQAGQSMSAGDLNAAYQRLVNSNLFQTVAMEPQGGTLVIRVSEYPIISPVSYTHLTLPTILRV